jgi:hypothetical protein
VAHIGNIITIVEARGRTRYAGGGAKPGVGVSSFGDSESDRQSIDGRGAVRPVQAIGCLPDGLDRTTRNIDTWSGAHAVRLHRVPRNMSGCGSDSSHLDFICIMSILPGGNMHVDVCAPQQHV